MGRRPGLSINDRNIYIIALGLLEAGMRAADVAGRFGWNERTIVGDYLGRKVRGRNDVNNVNDLERALHEEWARVPRQFIQRLINSMRRRCMAVIQARGGHTR